jgi:carbon monoxide dehydrogenase subunit G
MLKALGIIVALLVIAVIVILLIALQKPDTFRVQRSIGIKAPPDKIFPFISDFSNWPSWSPYEKKDPAMQRTMGNAAPGAAPAGKGATYEWNGDKNVGHGRMEILEAQPEKIVIKLDFYTPFEAHNTAEFTLVPKGAETEVTWAMHGPAPLMNKVMSTLMNLDKMVGGDFEVGLANLKTLAEK